MNRVSIFLPLVLCIPLAAADTIKLKSGEIIEGTIVEANAREVVVEVQFSPTIKDQQRIPRADIAGVERETRDEAAFAEIEKIELPETASDPRAHEAIVNGKWKPFLLQFSYSSRAADVKKRIADAEAEIARLQAGDVKVAGRWYDREAFAKEKYQIEADRLLETMKAAFAANDYPATLNAFETLMRNHPGSVAFAESAELANEAAEKFRQQLNFAIGNLQQTLTERRQTIERAPAGQRLAVEQAMKAEEAQAAAAVEAAQKANRRFFKVVLFDEKGLAVMERNLATLREQIDALDTRALARQAELARRAADELDAGQIDAAAETIESLRTAWAQYEALPRLDQRLRAAQADIEAAEASQPTPEPGPEPLAEQPANTPAEETPAE